MEVDEGVAVVEEVEEDQVRAWAATGMDPHRVL